MRRSSAVPATSVPVFLNTFSLSGSGGWVWSVAPAAHGGKFASLSLRPCGRPVPVFWLPPYALHTGVAGFRVSVVSASRRDVIKSGGFAVLVGLPSVPPRQGAVNPAVMTSPRVGVTKYDSRRQHAEAPRNKPGSSSVRLAVVYPQAVEFQGN